MGVCWATLARSRAGDRFALLAPGRAPLTFGRLAEHLEETRKRLRDLGVGIGDRVATVLADGPDAATAAMAVSSLATFVPLKPRAERAEYESLFLQLTPRMLLVHPRAPHPARDAARSLRIPVIEANRHFEAGVFTLEGRTGYAPVLDQSPGMEDIALI